MNSNLSLKDKIIKSLPFSIIFLVVLILTIKNIIPNTYFSGWDNSHPEFNVTEFTKRVVSGAWVEFQGTGAPASQSQLAEITRLPYIYLFKLLFPPNLHRYLFTFLMLFIGGLGIYFYLKKVWLTKTNSKYRDWISCFGALYYILNIVTLQEFYINFELFAFEFAYFPFVLLAIHRLSHKISYKNVLIFIGTVLLITPCAYVPTIFYLVSLFALIYAFFLNLQIRKNLFQSLKITGLIAIIIFAVSSYWMLPNLYYAFHNSQYVRESRANQAFNMEALWSVREAGTTDNFLTGIHFIFNWKDYNFRTGQYEFIYAPWNQYLSNKVVLSLLVFFNMLSMAGFITTVLDRKKGVNRWGMVCIYAFITVFIWMGLFLPANLFNFIYKFGVVQESFRNPFTKLSNFYSFVVTVMLCAYIEQLVLAFSKLRSRQGAKIIPVFIISLFFTSLIYTARPSFQGNFLNDKLRIKYPNEYFEMFNYLKTKPSDRRVLELPLMSDEGWLYYDWSNQGLGNGYQGMGFYFFGIPQALMTPDHARWVEATDSFYHELRQALNSQNSSQLKDVMEKYQIDMVIIDQTSIWKYKPEYDYDQLHQLMAKIGYKKIWEKSFLSIYESPTGQIKKNKLLVPNRITPVSSQVKRVRTDYVYKTVGNYFIDKTNASLSFPFSDLTSVQLNNIKFSDNSVSLVRTVDKDNYTITIPGIKNNLYSTTAQISYQNQELKIVFPKTRIIINDKDFFLPQFEDIKVKLNKNYDQIILFFNEKMFRINRNQKINPVVYSDLLDRAEVSYVGLYNGKGTEPTAYTTIKINQPDWTVWKRDIVIRGKEINQIGLKTEFPIIEADFKKFPSENCSQPKLGKITTDYDQKMVYYTAQEYGVNCSHYDFNYLTPDYPYLMHLSGKNNQGRSIRFFVDYNIKNALPEEYLMSKDQFDTTLSLMPIASYATKPYSINWETRSYGQTSRNELYKMEIMPFATDRLSQIELKKDNDSHLLKNNLKLVDQKTFLTFFYSVKVNCNSSPCFIGINQTYDDLWLAIDGNSKLLPHFKYNGWANLWQVNDSQKIIIIYIPQIVSYLCMFIVVTSIAFLIFQLKRKSV